MFLKMDSLPLNQDAQGLQGHQYNVLLIFVMELKKRKVAMKWTKLKNMFLSIL